MPALSTIDAAVEAGLGHQRGHHALGGRGPADVAQADEAQAHGIGVPAWVESAGRRGAASHRPTLATVDDHHPVRYVDRHVGEKPLQRTAGDGRARAGRGRPRAARVVRLRQPRLPAGAARRRGPVAVRRVRRPHLDRRDAADGGGRDPRRPSASSWPPPPSASRRSATSAAPVSPPCCASSSRWPVAGTRCGCRRRAATPCGRCPPAGRPPGTGSSSPTRRRAAARSGRAGSRRSPVSTASRWWYGEGRRPRRPGPRRGPARGRRPRHGGRRRVARPGGPGRASTTTSRSSSSRPAPATTTPSTSASTANDPTLALAAFVRGDEHRVDYATVNGRMFLNNVSLGVYAAAVEQPEYRDAKLETTLKLLPDLVEKGGPCFDLHDRRARARPLGDRGAHPGLQRRVRDGRQRVRSPPPPRRGRARRRGRRHQPRRRPGGHHRARRRPAPRAPRRRVALVDRRAHHRVGPAGDGGRRRRRAHRARAAARVPGGAPRPAGAGAARARRSAWPASTSAAPAAP